MSDEIKDPAGLLKAYEQAKSDLVSLRETLKNLESEYESVKTENETFKNQIEAIESDKVKGKVLETLKSQNVKNPESLLKYMDLSSVKEEDGKLTGLDDVIKTVKADFPERFIPRKAAAGSSADIHADAAVEKKPLTGSAAQAARITKTS